MSKSDLIKLSRLFDKIALYADHPLILDICVECGIDSASLGEILWDVEKIIRNDIDKIDKMSSDNYTSSIINKYGDIDKVSRDSAIVFEILDRQGSTLLIDLIAEYTGRIANKYKFHSSDRSMTIISLVDQLDEALKERL